MAEAIKNKRLFAGIRIYIAIAVALITAEVVWWAVTAYGTSTLAEIRILETYAWLSLILLAIAVTIGPFYKLFPSLRGRSLFFDGRRLLGISAAWFALMHVLIAYVGTFKLPNPFSLGGQYGQAFLFGIIALVILLLMAATSFDKAFRTMDKWWFRLHRLVYAAGLLALLHAFMIGVHAVQPAILILVGLYVAALIGMRVWISFVRGTPTALQVFTISYSIIFLLAIMNYGAGQYLGYNPIGVLHGKHHSQ